MPIFSELLPSECPPDGSTEEALSSVYRLVANDPPSEIDFASKAALGEPCPVGTCQCSWRSCSLFAKAKTLRSYPRLRNEYPYLAELNIPAEIGKYLKGSSKRGHIDFWKYSEVSLAGCVVNVEGPENDK